MYSSAFNHHIVNTRTVNLAVYSYITAEADLINIEFPRTMSRVIKTMTFTDDTTYTGMF